jgi:flagellar biosynthesis/type III secretory pathway chaperone
MTAITDLVVALQDELAALNKRIAYLESVLKAKDQLNAELVDRLQGRRRTPITHNAYAAAQAAPKGDM